MTRLAIRLDGKRRDRIGGLLILTVGLATALQATDYAIGTLSRMGPGFFPLALGVILAVIGVVIFGTAKDAPDDTKSPEWRGWLCICAGIAAFVVLGRYGGLMPATFAVVFISALGDRNNSAIVAALLAAGMTATCVIVFWWLLQIPFDLFRWG